MRRLATVMPLLLAACGPETMTSNTTTSGAATTTNYNVVANTARAGVAPAGPLSRYVGRYPFNDAVDGISFFQVPAARAAVDAAVADTRIRQLVLTADGPMSPIARAADGRLVARGCEAHNCGAHNWSLVVAPDGGNAEVCYHDDSGRGAATRWFRNGREQPARIEDCQPSG